MVGRISIIYLPVGLNIKPFWWSFLWARCFFLRLETIPSPPKFTNLTFLKQRPGIDFQVELPYFACISKTILIFLRQCPGKELSELSSSVPRYPGLCCGVHLSLCSSDKRCIFTIKITPWFCYWQIDYRVKTPSIYMLAKTSIGFAISRKEQ